MRYRMFMQAGEYGVLMSCASETLDPELVWPRRLTYDQASRWVASIRAHGLDGEVMARVDGEWRNWRGAPPRPLLRGYSETGRWEIANG